VHKKLLARCKEEKCKNLRRQDRESKKKKNKLFDARFKKSAELAGFELACTTVTADRVLQLLDQMPTGIGADWFVPVAYVARLVDNPSQANIEDAAALLQATATWAVRYEHNEHGMIRAQKELLKQAVTRNVTIKEAAAHMEQHFHVGPCFSARKGDPKETAPANDEKQRKQRGSTSSTDPRAKTRITRNPEARARQTTVPAWPLEKALRANPREGLPPPGKAWKPPNRIISPNFESRHFSGQLICGAFNKGRCGYDWNSCRSVHECLRCGWFDHGQTKCQQGGYSTR